MRIPWSPSQYGRTALEVAKSKNSREVYTMLEAFTKAYEKALPPKQSPQILEVAAFLKELGIESVLPQLLQAGYNSMLVRAQFCVCVCADSCCCDCVYTLTHEHKRPFTYACASTSCREYVTQRWTTSLTQHHSSLAGKYAPYSSAWSVLCCVFATETIWRACRIRRPLASAYFTFFWIFAAWEGSLGGATALNERGYLTKISNIYGNSIKIKIYSSS